MKYLYYILHTIAVSQKRATCLSVRSELHYEPQWVNSLDAQTLYMSNSLQSDILKIDFSI